MSCFNNFQEKMEEFVDERNWMKYHNPKNLSMAISVEASELMEIFQWMTIEESKTLSVDNAKIRNQLKDEIADIMIYCFSLANVTNLDLSEAIASKMVRNQNRFPKADFSSDK